MSDQEYEFSIEQNAIFRQLLKWLNLFSIFFIIAGALILVVALIMITSTEGLRAVPGLGIGLVMLALGILFRRPMDNVKNILDTQGRDISELMVAMKDFSQAFMSGAIIGSIFVVLVLIRLIALVTG
jgi:hypothetical protein